jgi:hypothetical protein
VRRQVETHRTFPLTSFCEEALLGFTASRADRRHIVGVNIVAAEDAYVSRIDYSRHMNLLGNLGRIYPQAGRRGGAVPHRPALAETAPSECRCPHPYCDLIASCRTALAVRVIGSGEHPWSGSAAFREAVDSP